MSCLEVGLHTYTSPAHYGTFCKKKKKKSECTAHVRTTHVRTTHVHTTHVRTTHVRTTHVRTTHVCTTHVRTTHVRTTHVRTTHVHTTHVRTTHVRTTHVHTRSMLLRFTTNGGTWLRTFSRVRLFQVCTVYVQCKRLHHRQLLYIGARFVCDCYSLDAPCAVGLRLPFPLFHVVPVLSSSIRMVYSGDVKKVIHLYHCLGRTFVQITHCLAKEGHVTTKAGVYKFIRRYKKTETIS